MNSIQYPEERQISQEELKYYKKVDYSIFSDTAARVTAQSDTSLALHKTIEYISPEEIFSNTIKTLEFKKFIQSYITRITDSIQSLKKIRDISWWQYWLQLELHIPKLEDRLKKIHDRVDINYKESNTHIQLSNRKKEIIQQERLDIKNEMTKFLEDLREYL